MSGVYAVKGAVVDSNTSNNSDKVYVDTYEVSYIDNSSRGDSESDYSSDVK